MDVAVECIDLEDIAEFLGFAPQHLFYLVDAPEKYYTSIEIPKKKQPKQN